jgi:hypothetical protein
MKNIEPIELVSKAEPSRYLRRSGRIETYHNFIDVEELQIKLKAVYYEVNTRFRRDELGTINIILDDDMNHVTFRLNIHQAVILSDSLIRMIGRLKRAEEEDTTEAEEGTAG